MNSTQEERDEELNDLYENIHVQSKSHESNVF